MAPGVSSDVQFKERRSAHQLHRTLDIAYQSAWFMAHRIRECMRAGGLAPMGGDGKIVEADETYYGDVDKPRTKTTRGRPYTKSGKAGNKRPIVALVERGGRVRTFHVPVATKEIVTNIVRENIAKESRLHTDESRLYGGSDATFLPTRASSTALANMSATKTVKPFTPTRLRAIFRSSSAACVASINIVPRNICTGISRNLISATITVSSLALTMGNVQPLPSQECRGQAADVPSASPSLISDFKPRVFCAGERSAGGKTRLLPPASLS